MASLPTLGMLAGSAVVVLASLVILIRFDVAARVERRRFEFEVRVGSARLVREAERARAVQRG